MEIYYISSLTLLVIGIIIISVCKYIRKKERVLPLKHITEDLPIIVLSHNNKTYNFLLDTGSTFSFISPEYIEDFTINDISESHTELTTGSGSANTNMLYTIDFKYNTSKLTAYLRPNEALGESFKVVEKCKDIKLHGLLGIDFIKDYINTIDFIREVVIMKN